MIGGDPEVRGAFLEHPTSEPTTPQSPPKAIFRRRTVHATEKVAEELISAVDQMDDHRLAVARVGHADTLDD